MAVVEVLQLCNPILRERSKPVLDRASKDIGKPRDDLGLVGAATLAVAAVGRRKT